MKKLLTMVLAVLMIVSLVGCTTDNATTTSEETTTTAGVTTESTTQSEATGTAIDNLVVYFVPSREPDEIITATEPLKALLKDALMQEGFDVANIDIQVGTTYEAVGEALSAGTADIGFIPGGTYVLYDDGADVILTATRSGLSKDSANAKDWNDAQATEGVDEQVTYYKGLLVAGPSEKGQALAAKVNAGETLTADDLKGLNWGVRSTSSSSGYIYPTIWLQDNFGISFTDIENVVQTDSYGSTMARLASEQIDVGTIYADARRDYADKWTSEYNREGSIWEETNVIGVTSNIYNDTISVSKSSEVMSDDLKAALQNAFISIASTDEGKAVIDIYAHEGYQKAQSSDYDSERKAQELLKSMQ